MQRIIHYHSIPGSLVLQRVCITLTININSTLWKDDMQSSSVFFSQNSETHLLQIVKNNFFRKHYREFRLIAISHSKKSIRGEILQLKLIIILLKLVWIALNFSRRKNRRLSVVGFVQNSCPTFPPPLQMTQT